MIDASVLTLILSLGAFFVFGYIVDVLADIRRERHRELVKA